MNITMKRSKALPAIAAAVLLPLSLAACSSSDSVESSPSTAESAPASSAPASSAPASPSAAASGASGAASMTFGEGCSAVPESGKGSFDGMSQDPVATAASNNPALSTLVTAVKAAELVDTLNNAEDITVFAPANSAFEDMDQKTLKKALGDPSGLLTKVLTMHVVGEKLTPENLAGEYDTLNKDQKIEVEGSGEDFTVNGDAKIVCGNVQTANATVYIIDKVLMPKS